MKKRTILVVIAVVVCLMAAVYGNMVLRTRAAREAFLGSSDLHAAIVQFMQHNAGRFPTREELAESPFVIVQEDGAWVVRQSQDLRVYGVPIRDLTPFEVQWGIAMESLHLGAHGEVVDANGSEVFLIKQPGWDDRSRRLTRSLYDCQRAGNVYQ